MSGSTGWNRREFIGAASLLALALGIPAAAVRLTDLDTEDLPSDRQQRLMAQVADLVIPRTDGGRHRHGGAGALPPP